MAHHQITFKRNEDGTYYAACSCGPTFERAKTKDEALRYMEAHVANLGVAFGVNTVGWSMTEPPTEPPEEEDSEAEEKPRGKKK
jgi:hypothetical protein